jgi:hypothetical protein
MIGTIEALGVFLLAILPGFLVLRVYRWGKPTLRLHSTLFELGITVVLSAAAWAGLYVWRGQELLPVVLGDPARPVSQRLDAFAELAGLSILLGFALGIAAKLIASGAKLVLVRLLRPSDGYQPPPKPASVRLRNRVIRGFRSRTLPDAAWDRLLTRLANRGEAVLCRVSTRSGHQVYGVFADGGFADWEADGRGLLLEPDVVRTDAGRLEPLKDSRGVFVPGDEIAVLSVLGLPGDRRSATVEDDD